MKPTAIALLFLLTQLLGAQTKAEQLFVTGNYSKAIAAYQKCKTCKPQVVNHKIAQAYEALGNYKKALAYYKKAINVAPNNLQIKYQYAKLLSKTKAYKDAKFNFEKLIENDSLNPNFHYQLGLVLQKQKDSLAQLYFKKAFSLDSTHQKAIFKIAKQHIIKRRFKEAHQILDIGLNNYQENVELISLKAQAYYFQEYYTHAIDWFNKLINLGEKSEFIHEKLSLSYAHNSDYKDAIFHRKEALNYNPYDATAMFVIGTYYEHISDLKNAEDYMLKALKLLDQSLDAEYQTLAFLYNRQKQYDKAIEAYKKAKKEAPKNVMIDFYLLMSKDKYYADYNTRVKLFENFIKNNPKHPLLSIAKRRLSEIKEDQFLKKE